MCRHQVNTIKSMKYFFNLKDTSIERLQAWQDLLNFDLLKVLYSKLKRYSLIFYLKRRKILTSK